VLDNDAHSASDFVGETMALKIARGAGLTDTEISAMLDNSRRIVQRISA
jgi:hypothetical protein